MKGILVGVEHLVGTSKKSGEPYDFKQVQIIAQYENGGFRDQLVKFSITDDQYRELKEYPFGTAVEFGRYVNIL